VPAALAAAIDRLLPAGPAEEQRVLHVIAHFLAAHASFMCSAAAAMAHLCAAFPAAAHWRGGRLHDRVAARPDALEHFTRDGGTMYCLRAAALVQAAQGLSPRQRRASAPDAVQPPAWLVEGAAALPPAVKPTSMENNMVNRLESMTVQALSCAHLIRLAAAAEAHWGPRGPSGAIHLRAALAMMDPARNKMAPLVLRRTGELFFACSYKFLGAAARLPRALPAQRCLLSAACSARVAAAAQSGRAGGRCPACRHSLSDIMMSHRCLQAPPL
jgi:hypothetical protein